MSEKNETKDVKTDEVINEGQAKETVEKTETTSEEKAITQAELDEIIAKRLARERSKYADYDELKMKLSEFEKAEEERKQAEMTEVERLQAQLEAKEKAEQELAQQLEETRNQANQERINNEFIKQATASNIAYVDAAIKLADLSAVEIGEDGKIKGVDGVIKELVEANPFLVEQAKKEPKQIGGGTKQSNDDEAKTLQAQLVEARANKDFMKVVELSNKLKTL